MTDSPSEILAAWLDRFAVILQNVAGPDVLIQRAGSGGPPPDDPSFFWWRYSTSSPKAVLWIGAAPTCRTALARIVSEFGQDGCPRLFDESWDSPGVLADRPPQVSWETVEVSFSDQEPIRLFLAVEEVSSNTARDLLLGIELPLCARFGRTLATLQELIGLKPGSLISFGRALDGHVELLVNGRVVARGEAVMVKGNYGVRIVEVASRRDLLETSIINA